jgi:hypothetical protein
MLPGMEPGDFLVWMWSATSRDGMNTVPEQTVTRLSE